MSEAQAKLAGTPERKAPPAHEPVMRSIAHRAHSALGATFERRAMWEVPARYPSEKEGAMGGSLAFADISARGKVHLSGAVAPLLRRLAGAPVEAQRIAPMRSGGVAACIARDWALALVPPGGEAEVIAKLEAELTDAAATDMTSAMSGFIVAGRRRDDFLVRTTSVRLDDLRPGRCVGTTWSKIPAVLVAPDLGAPAIEIYVASDYGRYTWTVVHDQGGRLGGSAVGWRALEAWGWT